MKHEPEKHLYLNSFVSTSGLVMYWLRRWLVTR